MRNVDLRILEGSVLHVRRLVGEAVALGSGRPVALDDKDSYVLRVESAETAIGYDDLSRVMNAYTFDFEGAPVKDLRISREEDAGEQDEIQLKGKLRKALSLPFEIEGRPEPTPDGKIRIRTTSIQALDVKVGGLLHALGMSAESLLGDLEQHGVSVDGEDMILDTARAFPPPRVTGRVTSVRVEDEGLVLVFGTARPAGGDDAAPGARRGDPPASPAAPAASGPPGDRATSRSAPGGPQNYLWFHEGTIKIGRMTMTDADLRIVDTDPRDPLDFNGDHITRQLSAGYAILAPDGGLTMHVPDYTEIH